MKTSNANLSLIQSIILMPSIERNESMCINEKKSWTNPIKAHLENQTLLKDKKNTEKIKK